MKKVYVLEYDNMKSYSDNEHYVVDIFENEIEANKAKDYYNKLDNCNNHDVIEYDLLDKFYKTGK